MSTWKIRVDMDGVLVDFINPTLTEMNFLMNHPSYATPRQTKLIQAAKIELGRDYFVADDIKIGSKLKTPRKVMYSLIRGSSEWWASLPWAPGGRELWNHVKQYDPIILTTPIKSDEKRCSQGKIEWVGRNLDLPPERVILTDKKYLLAREDREPTILIDDWSKNTEPFAAAGGFSILHVTGETAATIKRLKEIMDGNKR